MKRIILILLLAVFLFNVSGFYIVYSVMQYNNRVSMNALFRAKSSAVFVLKINGSFVAGKGHEIEHVDKNEIRYKGSLYDIVDIKREDGFVYFYCINDKKEEKLNEALGDCVEANVVDTQSGSGNTKDHSKLIKNIVKDYFPCQPDVVVPDEAIAVLTCGQQPSYREVYGKIFHPPPRLV